MLQIVVNVEITNTTCVVDDRKYWISFTVH